jgi:hypothetical protein
MLLVLHQQIQTYRQKKIQRIQHKQILSSLKTTFSTNKQQKKLFKQNKQIKGKR